MRIGIIGAGKIGTGIIDAIKGKGFDFIASSKTAKAYKGVFISDDNKMTAEDSDIILICVKPDKAKEVLDEIKDEAKRKIIMTFAAGLPIKFYTDIADVKVVRVMTTLALRNNKGAGAYVFSSGFSESEKNEVRRILEALGEYIELSGESILPVVTAISGSGIAYLTKIFDIFIKEGISRGLTKEQSEKLIIGTIKGSLSMMEETQPEQIVKQIAVPGGTTEQGLLALEDGKLEEVLKDAFDRTIKRAEEIGQ
ncbi:MAG: NAD(P)-binding domain-containing protein [Candidatus Aenigmarchaeota archaeon]|nr:NAD(P)-binding domain-containing protein [Candidatus Aenigmarchaeota archaeon]